MKHLNSLQPFVNPLLTVVVPVTVAKLLVAIRMKKLQYSPEHISEFMASHPSLDLDYGQFQSQLDPMLAPCPSLTLPMREQKGSRPVLVSAT